MLGVGPHLGNQIGVATAFELGDIDDDADVGPHPMDAADQSMVEREPT